MAEMMVGEGESNNDEAGGSPMWKFLKEEYDYKRPKRGDIRYAEVLRIDDDEIIVDIGGKTEGVVPSVDLDRMGEEAISEIEVGDKVPVYVLRPESADGDVIVSLNMARTMEDWRKAEKLFEEGGVYEGTVSGHNKGGLLVYYGQIRGFVPASQISGLSRRSGHEERMEMLSSMEGRELLLKVIEVDRQRRRLIFSERAASREWRDQRKDELLKQLQEGDIRTGMVRNLCDFGAFVDLGGADGLIHISELSWRRVKHARDVLKVGEEVEVYVLRVDRERKRIGLSLKRLQPDPWQLVEEKYDVGQIVRGVITNITDFGAFARIEDGIEGLVHVSELSDGDFAPRDLVREGEDLYLKVLSIDSTRQRMGLSLKQAPSREEIEGSDAWAELREEAAAEVEPESEVEMPPAAEVEPDLESLGAGVEPEADLEVAATEMEPEEGVPLVAEVEPEADLEVAATEMEPEEGVPLVAEVEPEADLEVAAAQMEPEEGVPSVAEVEAAAEEPAGDVGEAEEVTAFGEEQEVTVEPEEPVSDVEAAVELSAPQLEEEVEAAPESEEESPEALESAVEAEETAEEIEPDIEEQEAADEGPQLESEKMDEELAEESESSDAPDMESDEAVEIESEDADASGLEDDDEDEEDDEDDDDEDEEDDDDEDEDDEDEGDDEDEEDEDDDEDDDDEDEDDDDDEDEDDEDEGDDDDDDEEDDED
jgi:small subunit ribosomal protein S1